MDGDILELGPDLGEPLNSDVAELLLNDIVSSGELHIFSAWLLVVISAIPRQHQQSKNGIC